MHLLKFHGSLCQPKYSHNQSVCKTLPTFHISISRMFPFLSVSVALFVLSFPLVHFSRHLSSLQTKSLPHIHIGWYLHVYYYMIVETWFSLNFVRAELEITNSEMLSTSRPPILLCIHKNTSSRRGILM